MCANLLNVKNISKSYGARPLFAELSFSLNEGDRVGIIGPNGAGKSTFLRILGRLEAPDSGEISVRRNLRTAFLQQEQRFDADATARSVLKSALLTAGLADDEHELAVSKTASQFSLPLDSRVAELSGGWRKRLAIAAEMAKSPELLILDEPTNHLDLEGIQALERLLSSPGLTLLMVSHDRTFLENATNRVLEISPKFPGGSFSTEGNYSRYLEKREEYLIALRRNEQGLENRVRHEMEWLRRGPKARGTKARARIDEANRLIAALRDFQSRSRSGRAADIEFAGTGRKTKRLMTVSGISKGLGGKPLFKRLDFVLAPGVRIGLLGENGSGKTTLLKVLAGTLKPDAGDIECATDLKVVHFEQERESLNPEVSLRRTLAPEGDTVFYQGQPLHVASYAARFLFSGEMLNVAVGKLSGGEQARLLIARLMLQPADVLLLDEPTNDLDIDTLEVLEESLEEFKGSVVLVTHDRLMLDRISNVLVGLDPELGAVLYAEYPQWLEARKAPRRAQPSPKSVDRVTLPAKRKLSYLEKKELADIDGRIEEAEALVGNLAEKLQDPEISRDAVKLGAVFQAHQAAQAEVERLYSRWAELEALL